MADLPFWQPEPELREALIMSVSEILASQRRDGQFGIDPWICSDQNVMFPLAVAWSLSGSPFSGDAVILNAVVRSGDPLIQEMDDEGKWEFRKKDNSTWGRVAMPWTYRRWLCTYEIIRDTMPEKDRERWEEALLRGYDHIARNELSTFTNIPAFHASGLYAAGSIFNRPEWQEQARDYMHTLITKQSPYGWWEEHSGPVVTYNFVYTDAIGLYYTYSKDDAVLEALQRAAQYHADFSYPDGTAVETIDERNGYNPGVRLGNVGFTHTTVGRGYLLNRHAQHLTNGKTFDADYAAHILHYGGSGGAEPIRADRRDRSASMDDHALVVRKGSWFASFSGYTSEIPESRWHQDRQNMFSVYHDRTRLIIGSGNTKLQPLWSTFTVGDISLLQHEPGNESPDFKPKGELYHVPTDVKINQEDAKVVMNLTYGPEECSVTMEVVDNTKLRLTFDSELKSDLPVQANLTFVPHVDQLIKLASGTSVKLADNTLEIDRMGGWLKHNGWKLNVPYDACLRWPVLPHNPYKKTGDADPEEAIFTVSIVLDKTAPKQELTLEIL